jgi:hypothetical protein
VQAGPAIAADLPSHDPEDGDDWQGAVTVQLGYGSWRRPGEFVPAPSLCGRAADMRRGSSAGAGGCGLCRYLRQLDRRARPTAELATAGEVSAATCQGKIERGW